MKKRITFVLTVMIISVMFAAVGIVTAATEYKGKGLYEVWRHDTCI